MRWTIGMPSYRNFAEVYFTVQSLRLHHDLSGCEIVVVDNFGDPILESFCREKGNGIIRYEKFTDVQGVSAAKNRIFEIARGDYVLCMDSHILLQRGTLDTLPPDDDFVQGPCLFNHFKGYSCEWLPVWSNSMWGVWADVIQALPDKPFEIWATGAGFFCCKRESWLGFNPEFRGFGGETGYIQEKYRHAGRRVWCDPKKIWVHFFNNIGRKTPFDHLLVERVRNYLIGFEELGLDTTEMEKHFNPIVMKQARGIIARERTGIKLVLDHPQFSGKIAYGNILGETKDLKQSVFINGVGEMV